MIFDATLNVTVEVGNDKTTVGVVAAGIEETRLGVVNEAGIEETMLGEVDETGTEDTMLSVLTR